ncbi:flagellar basal body L-ring protein FlgH [bacterium]|nr:flagellar basal body L-ring protein FlgH [bacterium]
MATWKPAPPSDGSLWSASSVNQFSDDKASRRGDIVLVRINQKTAGTKAANTDTSRKASISAKIKYFLGLEDDVNKLTDYTKAGGGTRGTATWDPVNLIDASSDRSFKGEGSTNRTDTLVATVSAIVTEVMANGNLRIYGTQTVTLNNEASVLTVQGIVRPADLDVNNAVGAERIADAHIEFNGSGIVTDNQHPGWATRVFDWVWPF